MLEQICAMYPEADIFTHVVDRNRLSAALRDRQIFTTFIAKLPFAQTQYQKYLPLMPRALEQLDLSPYDLVISSEAGPAKGVITRPDAVHVTYCHSPMRYIWDQYHQYRENGGFGAKIVMPLFAPSLRIWDTASAVRSDRIVANSAFVAARIKKFWGRDATVVYPPVDTELYAPSNDVSDEYLWVGQLVPYKRPDIAVDAFNAGTGKLHIIGDGAMLDALRKKAGPNIRFSQHVDFRALRDAYAKARALVFTAEEDFGIIPVEVMASGRPVLAYGRGGALETVSEGVSGLFFESQSVESLANGLARLEEWLPTFDPTAAILHVQKFGMQQFRDGLRSVIDSVRASTF